MTRRSLGSLIGAALIATAAPLGAQAAPDATSALAVYFGNTLQISVASADWRALRHIAPDHTYRDTGTDGEIKGTWDFDGARICTLQTEPAALVSKYCNIGLGHKVGDTWTASDPVTGNEVTFHLVAGR